MLAARTAEPDSGTTVVAGRSLDPHSIVEVNLIVAVCGPRVDQLDVGRADLDGNVPGRLPSTRTDLLRTTQIRNSRAQAVEYFGGKGGTRTLDPGIMSAVL